MTRFQPVAVALFIALITSPLLAQRTIRESARDWQAARHLTLAPVQRWCTNLDAPGCDFQRIDDVSALPDGGVLASDVPGPLRRFSQDGNFLERLPAVNFA